VTRLRLATLRRDHPDRNWSAEQTGFGSWTYHGERGGHWVRVFARARFCMSEYGAEEWGLDWYVDNDGFVTTYWDWSQLPEWEEVLAETPQVS
jgi:hypothetical protein